MLYQSNWLRLESVDRIATLTIGSDFHSTPIATRKLLLDLGRALDVMQRCSFLDVLVIRGNGSGFLKGPDRHEVESLNDGESIRRFALAGQRILSRLSALSESTIAVAYIEGKCCGAGLELALACDYRLAVARPETLIGCDALSRGIFPCWGMTQRLPRLIGVGATLDLMLNDRMIPARAARNLGLVDHVFGTRAAKSELWSFVADLQDRPRTPNRNIGRRGIGTRLRESRPFVRRTAISPFRQRFRRPDQQALIRAVERGWFSGTAEGEAAERAAFLSLKNDPECRVRRDLVQRFDDCAAESETAIPPKRWNIIGMEADAIELGLLLLRSGFAVQFAESDPTIRESGRQQLAVGLNRCVSDGWLNVVEANQKQKSVAIMSDAHQLEESDVFASVQSGDLHSISCRTTDEWRERIALHFDGSPLSARTVEIQTADPGSEFSSGLVAALSLCGKRVRRPNAARPAPSLEFAA